MARFTILNDRRFWLILAFAIAMAGYPRGIVTDWMSPQAGGGTHPGGGDFLNFWIASVVTLRGDAAALYEPARFSAELSSLFATDFGYRWLYPPHFLLFVWPLALLPYWGAFALFMGAGLAAFLIVCTLVWRGGGIVFWLLAAPATLLAFLTGQTALLVGALLVGGIFWRAERPVLAGVLIGLLTIKPQFGVLLPLVLLLERRWLVIAAAAATALLLIGLSILAFGTAPWRGFLASMESGRALLATPRTDLLDIYLSTFGAARFAGFSLQSAGLLQSAASLFAVFVAICAATWRARADTKAALIILAAHLFTPYLLFYDLAAPTFVALALYLGRWREAPGMALSALLLATACLSFVNGLTCLAGIPSGPIALAALAGSLLVAARRERAHERATAGPSEAGAQPGLTAHSAL